MLQALYGSASLYIGSKTLAKTALSFVAEVVAVKNGVGWMAAEPIATDKADADAVADAPTSWGRPATSDMRGPAAIILAAGLGRRMGGLAKAALRIGETTILERLVQALRAAGVDEISAVIGPYREQMVLLLDQCGVQAIVHSRAAPSLIDSQRLALQSHDARFPDRDLLLVLGDLALLTEADVSVLLASWIQRGDHIHAQVPVVEGVRGHPVLLSGHAIAQINGTPDHLGVRDWLRDHAQVERQFATSATGYVRDIDTSNDLAAVQSSIRD